jgi:hypothetical protein
MAPTIAQYSIFLTLASVTWAFLIYTNILKIPDHPIRTAEMQLREHWDVSQLSSSCKIKSCLQILVSLAPNMPLSRPYRIPITAFPLSFTWKTIRIIRINSCIPYTDKYQSRIYPLIFTHCNFSEVKSVTWKIIIVDFYVYLWHVILMLVKSYWKILNTHTIEGPGGSMS